MSKTIVILRINLILSLFLLSVALHSQRSHFYTDSERPLKEGIDLYQKQKYGAAQSRFYDYLRSGVPMTRYAGAEANYYYAACAVELFHDNAEYLMSHFIEAYPESPKIVSAHFQLGKLFFRKKDYDGVIREFKQTDVYLLSSTEYFEYFYKLGYSQFMIGEDQAALASFAEVKDKKNLYQVPATYYYGHISYHRENYEVALQHFLAIKDDKNFSRIVPFYITQIYFVQKKYEETVQYGEPIADTLKGKNISIIRRILAESYYELKNYEKAIYNYEKYVETGSDLDRNGSYHFGLSYYRTGNFENAINHLYNAATEADALSQSAYYYLADCLIKSGDKRAALDILKLTYTLDFDKTISKEALYNFAKLSYELGYNPYNEAQDALNKYISLYPNDPDIDEIYELLVNIYMSVANYRDAIISIDKIKNKTTRLKMAEQRIYLFRGMELYNNRDYENAIGHFDKAIEKNYSHQVSSEAKFWIAETWYQLQNYEKAALNYSNFMVSPGARDVSQFNEAYYNLGYSYFKQKKYSQALNEFRIYSDLPNPNKHKLNDAYVRTADCYYVARNHQKAMEFYDKAIALNKIDNSYSYFQKALIQGIMGNQAGKAATLESAIRQFPNSPFREEMSYELGLSYLSMNKITEAVRAFESIVRSERPGKFLVHSYMQLGSIYHNSNSYNEALAWFKRVVEEFGGTRESQQALKTIQAIYVQMGDIEGWMAYAPDADHGNLDSVSYEAALNVYNKGDCSKSTVSFGNYLLNFPNGAFSLEAHHFKGECHYQLKEYNLSLPDYEFILAQRKNDYSENAALKAAWIYEQNKDSINLERIYGLMENIATTPSVLQKARVGLMKSKSKVRDFNAAINYARLVLTFDKLDNATEDIANYIIATSYRMTGQSEDAYAYYKKLQSRTSSEYFPESSYRMGEILFNKKNYKDAEKLLKTAVNNMGGQRHWLASSFILLSDIYVELKNYSQAKAVLQTVIDKHDGIELVNLAREKLDAVIALEQGKGGKRTEEPLEFDMQNKPRNIRNINENNIQN